MQHNFVFLLFWYLDLLNIPFLPQELIIQHVPIGQHALTIIPFANSEIGSVFNSVNYPFTMGKDNLIISVDALKGETELRVTSEELVPSQGRFKLDQSTIFDDF